MAKPTVTVTAKGAWLGLALSLVGAWEGLYTHAYKDSVGVTTICYGVTNVDRPVHMGDKYDVAQCKEMLLEDLPRYDAMVQKCVHVDMPPHRHAAIVSFTYNVGQGNLCKSSVARYLNAGKVNEACNALLLYNRGGGRVIKGLDNRRHAERLWCLRSD
jgi:lysozyme